MATPEGRVKAKLDAMLGAEGTWYFSPQAGPYGVAGIPDRIAIVCGLFLGIEVKANAKCRMTALQERCKKNIKEAGGFHFLVYDKETIEQVRQFILHVRARSSRQESGGCSLAQPRGNSQCNPKRKTRARQPSASPPRPGRDPSAAEPGALSP